MCEACERGDHANCGMQTWCTCDCDPELAQMFPSPDPYDQSPVSEETNDA